MFDQFTSRNLIREFLCHRMEAERETVNFVLGLFQSCSSQYYARLTPWVTAIPIVSIATHGGPGFQSNLRNYDETEM